MTNFEPELTPDDTQPRPAVDAKPIDAAPDTGSMIEEPPIDKGDTQPRPAVESEAASAIEEPPVEHGDTQPRAPISETAEDVDERVGGGCANTLLIAAVLAAFLCLFASIVALAGLAGYRDGTLEQKTLHAVALQGTVGVQATLARQDCDGKRFELCLERCRYIATAEPLFAGISACIGSAEIALSATPTMGITPSATPIPPTATATVAAGDGACSPEDLYVRSKESVRLLEYENAMKWLEALRGCNADYERRDVEDMLFKTYDALGHAYENQQRISEMIVVVRKLLDIRNDNNWAFTVNAASLYLDAKGYMVAGDYGKAARVFADFMAQAPTYLDGKQLACESFSKAGATDLFQKYNCGG